MCTAVVPQTTSQRPDLCAVCWLILQSLELAWTLIFWYSRVQRLFAPLWIKSKYETNTAQNSVEWIPVNLGPVLANFAPRKNIALTSAMLSPLETHYSKTERRSCHQMVWTKVSGIILVFWGINLYYRPNKYLKYAIHIWGSIYPYSHIYLPFFFDTGNGMWAFSTSMRRRGCKWKWILTALSSSCWPFWWSAFSLPDLYSLSLTVLPK